MTTINTDDEMNLHSCKLLVVLASVVFSPATVLIAAETDTADEATPVVISTEDATEAGDAADAFKQANPCEGMAQGDYLGNDVCADCHQDKIENMQSSPHGQAADPRSPYGREG